MTVYTAVVYVTLHVYSDGAVAGTCMYGYFDDADIFIKHQLNVECEDGGVTR